MKIDPRLPKLP